MKQTLMMGTAVALLLGTTSMVAAQGTSSGTEVQVQQAQPEITVQQPAPEVTVQQPAPEVTVQQAQPEVTVQQAEPQVTVEKQGEAEVNVIPPGGTAEPGQATAQQAPAEPQPMAPAGAEPAATATAQAEEMLGKSVVGTNGEEIGEVEDLLMDKASGQVQSVIVSYGGILGLGEKQVRIPFEQAQFDQAKSQVMVPMTAEQLETAEVYDEAQMGETMVSIRSK